MRWVDRGPEPRRVRHYGRRFTRRWVRYFREGIGDRPSDSFWREFRDVLGERSGNVCWYCERLCSRETEDGARSPTVDHFRPLMHFPELVYRWDNWVYSCLRCNRDFKGNKWPAPGYVDPSAGDDRHRPDEYFDYDADTGEIMPQSGLNSEARQRALRTIDDLGLNSRDVLNHRLDWTRRFTRDWEALPAKDREAFAEFSTRAGVEFAGAALMVVRQLQATGEG